MSPAITLIKSRLDRMGGLEKYTWQMAEQFCQSGAQVTLLTTHSPTPPFQHPNLHIVSLPVQHSSSALNVLHFDHACHHYIKKHPTPILFSLDRNRFQTHHRAGNGAHIAYLKRRAKEEGWWKKTSFAINPLHRAILHLEKKAFEHPDLKILFTNSQMVKEEILTHYATDPHKIQVVHNGVEWVKMQLAFDKWEEEKQKHCLHLKLSPNAHQLLFVGHNYQRKGLEKLLNALSLLRHEDFQLSIVGKEKMLSHFQDLSAHLGLSKKVFFFGAQNSVTPFYQIADTLVLPSLYDPFANVTIEALSMGLFVLSSMHNGGKEILTPHNGQVIEDLDDTQHFAHLLQRSFQKPKTRTSAQHIRESVKDFDFSLQLKKLVTLTLVT